METTILEDLGFTNAEIKIYLSLLELGESTAGPILDKSGLQNSVVHMTLHKLLEKGLISYVIKGKTKHYRATNPKNILKIIDEKKTQFQNILPELLSKQKTDEPQTVEIYEGFKGFKSMIQEFIKGAKKGDEYLFFSIYTKNLEDLDPVYNFYKEFDKERAKLGIITKGLAPIEIKEKFKGRKKIKFVRFPIPTNISIFKDKVILTPWEDKQVSFLISSRQLAENYRSYFYSIYNKK